MARWGTLAGTAALAAACVGGYAAASAVERRVAGEVERVARGAGASVRSVRFSWLGPLRLEGVSLRPDAQTQVGVDAVDVRWRAGGGGDARAHVSGLTLRGMHVRRGALAFDVPDAAFDVMAWEAAAGTEQVRLRQRPLGGTVEARWTRGPRERTAELRLDALDLSAARVQWAGDAVLEPGRWSGQASVHSAGGRAETEGALSLRAARVSLGRLLGLGDGMPGEPTDVALAWSARRDGGATTIERASAELAGLHFEGRGRFAAAAARGVDAEMSLQAELGGALRTAGLRLPDSLEPQPARLGTAWFEVSVRGPLADASALRVVPRLRFESAPEAVEALQYLRRPFGFVPQPAGARILVSAGAPDFAPLGDVPPLFVRMILLSEDAGFFGHPGIDVAEIPAAWATNVERGGFARGASTITQQLARNLFLSRDKSYARKLEEAALALMLDAAVPKTRILEIYLNVIEWGPGIHGLVPAARHYFGKHPSQLTVKEMAFLVCLVPSPIRYHSAHRAGHVGPGMEQLMQNLLAKMLAAGDLSEEGYAQARDEALVFRPEGDDLAVRADS